jgi:hypothetical protein
MHMANTAVPTRTAAAVEEVMEEVEEEEEEEEEGLNHLPALPTNPQSVAFRVRDLHQFVVG